MIAIVHHGMGNLHSVAKALEVVGHGRRVMVTEAPGDLSSASHIVLPGVGNFQQGMANLRRMGMVGALEEAVLGKGKPFLGICLGMQLLADVGEEYGETEGLGWIRGRVRPLRAGDLYVPHLGWNTIAVRQDCGLFRNVDSRRDFFFVHSYVFECHEDVAVAHAEYGERFVAALKKGNINATQFHPEKSRSHGLRILEIFVQEGECSSEAWFLSSS